MHPETLLNIPPGLLLTPVAELAPEVLTKLDVAPTDVALTLPHSRNPSLLVDSQTAAILERFHQPRTLVDAVILHSSAQRKAPQEILEGVYPVVERLVRRGLLVDAQAPVARRAIEASYQPGETLDDLVILRALQVLVDTEVYQVRLPGGEVAALKMRRPSERRPLGSFAAEAWALERLTGQRVPQLLRRGNLDGHESLLLSWCSGVAAHKAATEWRLRPGAAARQKLLCLVRRIARAYAELHRLEVLHGDVHGHNVLVDASGEVNLIDFGLAIASSSVPATSGKYRRGGVSFFFEPEHARSSLAGRGNSPPTAVGEQYAVAALLYLLVTGTHTHDFRLEKRAMMQQLANEPVKGFAERDLDPWPELETVLLRALSQSPEDRFPSMEAFAMALESVPAPQGSAGVPLLRMGTYLENRAEQLLASLHPGGEWFEETFQAPAAPVVFGSAGVAFTLLRVARQREDPELLTLADLWCRRAEREGREEEGFVSGEREIHREVIGEVSPYHTASGIAAVSSLVAGARGDLLGAAEAAESFCAATRKPVLQNDLNFGTPGVLLLSAFLIDGIPHDHRCEEVCRHGSGLIQSMWSSLDHLPAMSPQQGLGIAHGWAGSLYASLHWWRTSGEGPPGRWDERLNALADLAEPSGRGVRWPWIAGDGRSMGSMPGWCNGSAGFVFLWTLAWRLLGESRYLDLALGAGWDAWESADTTANLCCGLAGRAWALLNLYKNTGESLWLARARDLAERAAREGAFSEHFPHGLYKGELALLPLAVDLERPEEAAFPFFEEEGWEQPSSPIIDQQTLEAGLVSQGIPNRIRPQQTGGDGVLVGSVDQLL